LSPEQSTFAAAEQGKFGLAIENGRIRALPRSAAVSQTSRRSFAKPARWNKPDAVELFNVLRLVLCTQPRSNLVAFGSSARGCAPRKRRKVENDSKI
jgi:hypothetical protein